jgi:hypothetical protein
MSRAESSARRALWIPLPAKRHAQFWGLTLAEQARRAAPNGRELGLFLDLGELVDAIDLAVLPDVFLTDAVPNLVHGGSALAIANGLRPDRSSRPTRGAR